MNSVSRTWSASGPTTTAATYVGMTVEYGRMWLREDGEWGHTDDVVMTFGKYSPWELPAMYFSMYRPPNVLNLHDNQHVLCLLDTGPPFDPIDWSELYVLGIQRCPLFHSLPQWTCFTALHTLQLIGTGLLPASFDSIDSLTSLLELELEGANLQALPAAVCRVLSLRKLKTRGMSLPAATNDLVNLESLTVADSGELGTLPALPALLKLRELDVRHSTTLTIPVLPSLHRLAVDLHRLDFAAFVDVLPGFTELRNVETFGGLFHGHSAREAEALARALHAWPLAHLRLCEQRNVVEHVAEMPAGGEDWDDCSFLAHFNKRQGCMVAFLGGGHNRLGSESLVGLLTPETLRAIGVLVQDTEGAAEALAAAKTEMAMLRAGMRELVSLLMADEGEW